VTDLDPGGVDTTGPPSESQTVEDAARSEPGRGSKRSEKSRRTRRTIIEWTILIGSALLIAILIKTFLFQAFYIPSESMKPTLNVGDRVLVNKVSYRLHDVNRGDIVVFTTPPKAKDANKALLESVWRRSPEAGMKPEQIEALYMELQADERARQLYESYKEEAIRSLRDVENPNLKGLLRRVIGKIFNDTEIKGWCKEFEQKNAARRSVESPASCRLKLLLPAAESSNWKLGVPMMISGISFVTVSITSWAGTRARPFGAR